MILLALDTALEACSVAISEGDHVRAALSERMQRGHQERLTPMVAETMAGAGLAFAALDRVAVTVGPGSFTGLRVGLAFAKSMALALGVPCLGVGTLEALLASDEAAAAAPRAAAALDARRGRVYLQAFSQGRPLGPAENLPLEEARERLTRLGVGPDAPLVGAGAALLREGAAGCSWIDPAALARLAAIRPLQDGAPAPLYLRAPDARTIAERLADRAAPA